VATLVPLGTPVGGLGKGGLLGALGGFSGLSRSMEASQFQIAMDALSGRSMFSLSSPELLEESIDSATPRRYSMGMAYVDDRRPPEEAWGKKFNSLPLLRESGSMVTYHDAVYQIAISSMVRAYMSQIRVTNRLFDYFHMRTSFRVRAPWTRGMTSKKCILLK
jgi:hypothetical protein